MVLMAPAQVRVDRFLRTHSMRGQLDIYEKILIFFLASYMGNKSECYPSINSLVIDCSMSIKTVKRKIHSLEKKKIIRVIRERGKNNRYVFNEQLGSPNTLPKEQLGSPRPYYRGLPDPTLGSGRPPNIHHNNISKGQARERSKRVGTKLTKTFLPNDIIINDSHQILASELGVDLEMEFEKFKEWHLAKGSQFVCWDNALNHWLRRAAEFMLKRSHQNIDIMAGVGYET